MPPLTSQKCQTSVLHVDLLPPRTEHESHSTGTNVSALAPTHTISSNCLQMSPPIPASSLYLQLERAPRLEQEENFEQRKLWARRCHEPCCVGSSDVISCSFPIVLHLCQLHRSRTFGYETENNKNLALQLLASPQSLLNICLRFVSNNNS